MNLIDKSINIKISHNISILLPLKQKKTIYNPKNIKKKTKHACFLKETVNFK